MAFDVFTYVYYDSPAVLAAVQHLLILLPRRNGTLVCHLVQEYLRLQLGGISLERLDYIVVAHLLQVIQII